MAYAQTQKVSGAASTQFGKTVAIQGYYAAIADNSGNGYLYKRQIDGTWAEDNTFTMGSAGSTFGDSLDIGDEYFVAGEPGYSNGRAGVYAVSDPSTLIQPLVPAGLVAGDSFGSAIAISDDYIAVGASGADLNKGDVYLFIKGTGGSWSEYSGNPITPTFRTAEDFFGCAVALSGDSIIIGASGDNNKTGAVHIFEMNSDTGEWEESQKIFASDGTYNDVFGATISASGGYFIAGASWAESAAGDVNSGATYIYKYGTVWYEVDKLIGTSEDIYTGNHFGAALDINGDYVIIGSPDARGFGVADTFYKKRSWGHQTKILGSDSLSDDDDFGAAVSICGRFIISGSPGEGSNGAVYFYEDPPVRLRLSQEFDVNAEYLPSKATVYLKRIGRNTSDYWPIYNTADTVIDATNFSEIVQGSNIVMLSDGTDGFTGNGYMVLMNDDASSFGRINYPMRAISADTFTIWLRCISLSSTSFQADIFIDGQHSKTINETVADPSDLEWSWVSTTLVLPDVSEHTIGIRIRESGNAIDKLYITADDDTPYSEGPDYGESPYFTVHMQVYDSDGSPDNVLHIYDYKNSITHVNLSDWYNFNISVLDSNHGYTSAADFSGSYFLVMSTSGSTTNNFVVWEMIDNDEYMSSPSAFRF